MAAYRRVYGSHHLQADCQEPGSAPEPYTLSSGMGYLYLSIHRIGLACHSADGGVRQEVQVLR